ncbi:hypothetical protein GY45DRAFT_457772 [Cubamyces sp. BRFM 1775]|nr:hypothetical protein GY45DRAFT_457772 [Cubamyces sp. BRFM 1775]
MGVGCISLGRSYSFSSPMDSDQPLIDLGLPPALPGPGTPLLPLETALNNLPDADISLTPQAPGAPAGDDPPAQQSQLNTAVGAKASNAPPPRRFIVKPWYFIRVYAVYIGPVKFVPRGISPRWLLVSEVVFWVMAAGQIALIAVLMALGAINKDTLDGARTELRVCPELVVASLLWLVRPLYVGYLLLWARVLKRAIIRVATTAVLRSLNTASDEALTDGTQAEHTNVEAEIEFTDEDYKLPTEQSERIHLRLVTLTPLLTLILQAVMTTARLARRDYCDSRAPHISLFTSIMSLVGNMSLMVHYLPMFISLMKKKMRRR